ncbi:MAG TPA: glycosyltransferase [Vicinamibacterales bacterium]|nr:glycosyltransferase [Vicinamibacterales bacterium]
MLPRLSIVVAFTQRPPHLDRCLDSIEGGRYPRDLLELIVVDNRSCAESIRMAREHGAVVVKSTGTLAELLNVGARAALGDILVFVSPESEVEAGWFDRVVDVLTNGSAGWLAPGKMAIRRTPFEAVGTFDPSGFVRADDDICHRLRLAGHQVTVERQPTAAA